MEPHGINCPYLTHQFIHLHLKTNKIVEKYYQGVKQQKTQEEYLYQKI